MSNMSHNFSLDRARHGKARGEDEDQEVNAEPQACPQLCVFGATRQKIELYLCQTSRHIRISLPPPLSLHLTC